MPGSSKALKNWWHEGISEENSDTKDSAEMKLTSSYDCCPQICSKGTTADNGTMDINMLLICILYEKNHWGYLAASGTWQNKLNRSYIKQGITVEGSWFISVRFSGCDAVSLSMSFHLLFLLWIEGKFNAFLSRIALLLDLHDWNAGCSVQVCVILGFCCEYKVYMYKPQKQISQLLLLPQLANGSGGPLNRITKYRHNTMKHYITNSTVQKTIICLLILLWRLTVFYTKTFWRGSHS